MQDPRRNQGTAGARLIVGAGPLSRPQHYRGRFAPSPTGPLHFGSLLAALASYLDARHHDGVWLLRIEDLDPPREVAGAADAIRRSLERHGLHWDGEALFQSQRLAAYDAALETLHGSGRLFRCSCTRAVLGPGGSCRRRCSPGPDDVSALRLALVGKPTFDDFILGPQHCTDVRDDIVLRRRDGLHAYALAVVVDDAYQEITHVVRGRDLLTQTPAQLEMFPLLLARPPAYGHVPLIHNSRGVKLSKQSGAAAIDDDRPLANLRRALRFLHQDSADAEAGSVDELLRIAACRWARRPLAEVRDASLEEEASGNA